jgi:ribonuclease P protein component
VGVSKKNFNRAVDRNRIKRLTREAYRLQKANMEKKIKEENKRIALFFIYTARELPTYPTVYQKMDLILNRMISLANENGTHPA